MSDAKPGMALWGRATLCVLGILGLLLLGAGPARADQQTVFSTVVTKYAKQLSWLDPGDYALDPWTGKVTIAHLEELFGWGVPNRLLTLVRGLALRKKMDKQFDWTEAGISLRRYILEPVAGLKPRDRVGLPMGFLPFADEGKGAVLAGFMKSKDGAWWVWQYDTLKDRLVWVDETLDNFVQDQVWWELAALERDGMARHGKISLAMSRKALVLAVLMKVMDVPRLPLAREDLKSLAGKMLPLAPNRDAERLLTEFMENLPTASSP